MNSSKQKGAIVSNPQRPIARYCVTSEGVTRSDKFGTWVKLDDYNSELERIDRDQLRRFHFIVAIVQAAGGEVTIKRETLEKLDQRYQLLQKESARGDITLEVLKS